MAPALVGYDVEVAEAVADKLGLEIAFQETQWDAIFAGLEAKRFDVIANQVSITPEREEVYAFSAPYAVSGVIVVKDNDDSISSFDDLAARRWPSRSPATGLRWPKSRVQTSKALKDGRRLLRCSSRVVWMPPSTQADLPRLRDHEPRCCHQDRCRDRRCRTRRLPLMKDNAALAEAITGALDELRTDVADTTIGEKYFGTDISSSRG